MYNLKDTIVRILKINIKNYKNVEDGRIRTGEVLNVLENRIDIRGIYGQNGSGKTSIISAIGLVKQLMMGNELFEDVHEYITFGKSEMKINVLFYIKVSCKEYKVEYELIISKKEDMEKTKAFIKEESVNYWRKNNGKWDSKRGLIINKSNLNTILPKYRNAELEKLYGDTTDLIVDKKMRLNESKSFIFSNNLLSLIDYNRENVNDEYEVLDVLSRYSISNLFIIDNKQLALSDANILLPMNFKNYKLDEGITMGVMPIGLEGAVYMPRKVIDEINYSLDSSNKVLKELIPGLIIKLKELSIRTSKSGEEEILVELVSCRDKVEIPTRYESDGIKKIIAVLHLLIGVFNYTSMTVLVDELDAGIFEYLLGEILEVLELKGKGQLIFTSHNLRPLEVLNKNKLVFTTTNPKNRYIKLKNVNANNNLRDFYYRDLILGGQDEKIYDVTSSAKISRAFRKAGD